MGRIAGESRGDARIRRGCSQALDTLMRLMQPDYDPAIQLRAATVMVRTFATVVSGIAANDQPVRITWEEYVRGIRELKDNAPNAGEQAGTPSPATDGDLEH